MNDRISVRLLLSVLSCSAIGFCQAQAQPIQFLETSSSGQVVCAELEDCENRERSPASKQDNPPQFPPLSPLPALPSPPPNTIPPPPSFSIPSRSLLIPGGSIAGPEAAQRIFLLSPIVAAYADANLPQDEAALIDRLRQQVSPDSRAEDLLWASLFDAHVEREAYPQAIAAFNQLRVPSAEILYFVESLRLNQLNPQLVSLLPTLKHLIDEHSQSGLNPRAALMRLMTLYHAANLEAESRAIAQQLRTLEAEESMLAEERLTTEFTPAALIADPTAQQRLLQSTEIATRAGETAARDRILQHLESVVTSSQFRQHHTASVTPDPTAQEEALGQQAWFLIGVGQQLIAAEQPERAMPLLDQAAQWLQQRPNFPFHENSQAETLILAYTTARQPASVLRLLQALSPSAQYQNQVRLQVIEQATLTGQEDFAVQVAQQPFVQPLSRSAEETLRRLAAAGQFDAVLALATNSTTTDHDYWIPVVAAYAIQADRPDVATSLVESPLPANQQPPVADAREPERAAQLQAEAEFTTQMNRWLAIAQELIEQEQPTQAQDVLQRVHQRLETWQRPAYDLAETQPLRPWFTLAERYAQAGQSAQAIALLNRLWQQEQQMVAARSTQPMLPFLLPPILPYFPFPSTFRPAIPSLAAQVASPLFRPSLPLPSLFPTPSPVPQSFQAPVEAIAQLPPRPLKDNAQAPPVLLDEFRRADYSRYYLQAGDVARAWELFHSIPEGSVDMKSRLARDLVIVASTSGQPDMARQLFPLAYPSGLDGEDLLPSQAEEQIEVWLNLANLYIERMDSENARQMLQQAEAIAWTVPSQE